MSEFYSTAKENRFVSQEVRTADGEQNLHNRGMYISFTRPGNETKGTKDITVNFKAFITAYNETFLSNWTEETIYGRADPVPMYKNVRRKITLAFQVPATGQSDAYENLGKVQTLIQFLYPEYTKFDGDKSLSQTITRSPFIKLHFMNLIQDTRYAGEMHAKTGPELYKKYSGNRSGKSAVLLDSQSGNGLLGAVTSFTVQHNVENPAAGVIEKNHMGSFQGILPKLIEINLSFEPIHQHPLGWSDDGKFGGSHMRGEDKLALGTFPYGAKLLPNISGPDIEELEDDSNSEDEDKLPIGDLPVKEEDKAPTKEEEEKAGKDATEDNNRAKKRKTMNSALRPVREKKESASRPPRKTNRREWSFPDVSWRPARKYRPDQDAEPENPYGPDLEGFDDYDYNPDETLEEGPIERGTPAPPLDRKSYEPLPMGSLDEYGIDDMDEDFVELKPDVYQRASGVEMGNTKKNPRWQVRS